MSDPSKFRTLARAGYATRGAVYIIVGGLAAVSVWGSGGGQSSLSSQTAIEWLLRQPFGQFLIWAVTVGLAFFVLWRMAQALLNADNNPNSARGIVKRIGMFVSGVTYAALAIFAGRQALNLGASGGSGGGSGGNGGWTQMLLEQPYGRYLVGAVGVVVVIAGIVYIVEAIGKRYAKYLEAKAAEVPALDPICMFGLAARGAIFVIIGGLIIWGALGYRAQSGAGLGEALSWLQSQPYGAVLYGLAALGLIAFGVFNLILARYRLIDGTTMAQAKAKVKAKAH